MLIESIRVFPNSGGCLLIVFDGYARQKKFLVTRAEENRNQFKGARQLKCDERLNTILRRLLTVTMIQKTADTCE